MRPVIINRTNKTEPQDVPAWYALHKKVPMSAIDLKANMDIRDLFSWTHALRRAVRAANDMLEDDYA